MVFRPEVFVSACVPEMASYREAVMKTLKEMGIMPVVHTDYTVPYGPLDGVLKVAIGRCEAVIYLVGFAFGIEPSERTLGSERRSFCHYEFDVALTLKKPVYCFVA